MHSTTTKKETTMGCKFYISQRSYSILWQSRSFLNFEHNASSSFVFTLSHLIPPPKVSVYSKKFIQDFVLSVIQSIFLYRNRVFSKYEHT